MPSTCAFRVVSGSSAVLPGAEIHINHWLIFVAFVAAALLLDLGVFHRKSREVSTREALAWTSIWGISAMLFAWVFAPRIVPDWTSGDSASFLAGYLVEISLSMDNVFVIACIFSYFRVPAAWQHRVLFWGILGALIMRMGMILAGSALIAKFHWILYVMGAFLIFTGIKMLRVGEDSPIDPSETWIVRLLHRWFPISNDYDGDRFLTKLNGRIALTPLAIVLVVVETTDVVFALDSIPAIFGVTQKPFLVFTSNIFAILGLRSLYFLLANAMKYFRWLKVGLSFVLVVIGVKMLLHHWLHLWLGDLLTPSSLCLVFGILGVSVIASIVSAASDSKANGSEPKNP